MTHSIIGGTAGGSTTDVTDRVGRAVGVVVQGAAGVALWKVDASGAAVPVTDGGGSLTVDSAQLPTLAGGRLPVDGSGVVQPVSATDLPLPTGAATEATLAAVRSGTDRLPQQQPDGTVAVSSTPERLLLEKILLEVRIQNEQLALLTGRGQLDYPENQRGL